MSPRRLFIVAALLVVSVAVPAAAHVTVQPPTLPGGGFQKVTFRVPNERDNASTTQVEVDLPVDQALASVQVKPVPGWTVATEKTTLAKPIDFFGTKVDQAVTKITWSGGKIAPGEFQEFEVSGGAFPAGPTKMVFKAIQTYDNGEIVRWIETAAPGAAEPEHPAPTLTLTAAAGESPVTTTAASPDTSVTPETVAASTTKNGDSGKGLAVAALAVSVVALAAAAASVVGGRRRS